MKKKAAKRPLKRKKGKKKRLYAVRNDPMQVLCNLLSIRGLEWKEKDQKLAETLGMKTSRIRDVRQGTLNFSEGDIDKIKKTIGGPAVHVNFSVFQNQPKRKKG